MIQKTNKSEPERYDWEVLLVIISFLILQEILPMPSVLYRINIIKTILTFSGYYFDFLDSNFVKL